jgi:small-conductance mechanosensitive channel
MPLTSLTVLLGAFGVGIGFGLQNIFNNLVSGLILLFERPVQIGDTIEVGTLIGKVKSIGIRASNIQTFDGAEVIVPNGHLISNEVINWTLSDQQRRIEVIVGVSYDSDPHKVQKLMMQILTNHKEIMQDPEPRVFFNELGESSLDFRLLFWTTSFSEWLRIRSEIVFEVFDLLKENDIEIPFPQRDLHVKSIEQKLKIETSSNKL